MPSSLVLVQFPRRIRVSNEDVEAELDSSNRKIPFHRPPLRAGKPQRESSKRSRLVRQATVHFGAEKLQASRQSLNASAFKAAIAEDANVQQTPCGSLAPTAADGSTMPDVREDEDHIVIEVEAMVRAMLTDFLEAGYLQGHPTWTSCPDGKYMNVSFACHADLATLIVLKLEFIGIGSDVGAVNATPIQVGRSAVHARKLAEKRKEEQRQLEERKEMKRQRTSSTEDTDPSHQHKSAHSDIVSRMADAMADVKRSAKQHWGRFFVPEHDTKFLKVASVFRVEELSEQIAGMALFSFDYIMFVAIASIIAAVGLATDQAVIVVAAMLVSPIMGPIMAFTFGYATKDWGMVVSGIVVELVSLAMCIAVGFVYATCSMTFLEEGEWPTDQMHSRGDVEGLRYGIVVAIPSGMGVALSLLDQNVGGLVGVAISASLLPPAVGAGMYWAFAVLGNSVCDFTVDSEMMAHEGAISFSLTMINIVCVTFSALFMFNLKRVVPSTQNESFWKRDLHHARSNKHAEDECWDLPSVQKLLNKSSTQSHLHYDALGPAMPEAMQTIQESKC